MEDQEFVTLDPPQAQVALEAIKSDDERIRLKSLYAETRGFLVDGTGWKLSGAKHGRGRWLEGRSNRAQYWSTLAFVVVLYVGLRLALHTQRISVSEVVLMWICIPRLHDLGRTGWWAAAGFAGELVALFALLAILPPKMAFEAFGLVVVTLAVLLIILGVLPGEEGTNRFGPPPPPGIRFWRKAGQTSQIAATFD